MMFPPLKNYILPSKSSQGWFGAERKFDIHTGIDLYCDEHKEVFCMEDGIVLKIIPFTGEKANSPWWNNTDAILIKGQSGIILYGEVSSFVKKDDIVREGDLIGKVLRVLKNDKGLPTTMLHLELYEHEYEGEGEVWELGKDKPKYLLDPIDLINKITT